MPARPRSPPAAKPAAGQTAPDADTVFDATPKGLEPDLRFTCDSAGAIYLIARGWHAPIVSASSLGLKAPGAPRVASVTLLGSVTAPTWRQTDAALEISFPASRPGEIPIWVFKVVPATSLSSPAL